MTAPGARKSPEALNLRASILLQIRRAAYLTGAVSPACWTFCGD